MSRISLAKEWYFSQKGSIQIVAYGAVLTYNTNQVGLVFILNAVFLLYLERRKCMDSSEHCYKLIPQFRQCSIGPNCTWKCFLSVKCTTKTTAWKSIESIYLYRNFCINAKHNSYEIVIVRLLYTLTKYNRKHVSLPKANVAVSWW